MHPGWGKIPTRLPAPERSDGGQVTMHPGEAKSPLTWSFHQPISAYTKMLTDNGFVIEKLEEWTSDKESVGKAGKMENRARAEFPLFLAILARLAL